MQINRNDLRDIGRALAHNRMRRAPAKHDRLFVGGALRVSVDGELVREIVIAPNLVTQEGRIYVHKAIRPAGTSAPAFFAAPFKNAATPQDNWTAANFNSLAAELTNYTQTTRQELTWPAAGDITGDTITTGFATVTLGTGADRTINGCGIISSQAKGAGTGLLLAAVPFNDPLSGLPVGANIGFQYVLTLANLAE